MRILVNLSTFIVLFIAFLMPIFDEYFISNGVIFYTLIIFIGFNSLLLALYWYCPIFKYRSGIDVIDEIKENIYYSPNLFANYTPKFDYKKFESLLDVNGYFIEKWFSSFYFGIAALGFGGQASLWLGDLSSLTSGAYGAPLKYLTGRMLYSGISSYFLVLGASVFFVGILAKIFSRKFK